MYLLDFESFVPKEKISFLRPASSFPVAQIDDNVCNKAGPVIQILVLFLKEAMIAWEAWHV